ncbi:MAG: SGNH/GDSL hydrolase family protein [Isosphaeraceae bacterium]
MGFRLPALVVALGLTGVATLETIRAQATAPSKDQSTRWSHARDLTIEGRGWTETLAEFDRLPAKAEGVVRAPVWGLSRDSTGLTVRFVSDAPSVQARWTLRSSRLAMPHMPATGVSGLDLYARDGQGNWRWLGVGQPRESSNTATLATGLPSGTREFLLYLPLYNGLTSLEIGVPTGCSLDPGPARPEGRRKPMVFYGTSITQGGCASRPGMVHTAILSRRLERPVINLGFSGNGKMEPEMARLLAELDPSVYVLDCLPNMTEAEVRERVEPFVRILRTARPETPIVLAEDRTFSNAALLAGPRARNEANRSALKAAARNLESAGVTGLAWIPGDPQLGDDGEATVDGSHPTDLGFLRMADAFETVLRPLLDSPR